MKPIQSPWELRRGRNILWSQKNVIIKSRQNFSRRKKKNRQISLLEKSFKMFCKENPEIHKEDNTVWTCSVYLVNKITILTEQLVKHTQDHLSRCSNSIWQNPEFMHCKHSHNLEMKRNIQWNIYEKIYRYDCT